MTLRHSTLRTPILLAITGLFLAKVSAEEQVIAIRAGQLLDVESGVVRDN